MWAKWNSLSKLRSSKAINKKVNSGILVLYRYQVLDILIFISFMPFISSSFFIRNMRHYQKPILLTNYINLCHLLPRKNIWS